MHGVEASLGACTYLRQGHLFSHLICEVVVGAVMIESRYARSGCQVDSADLGAAAAHFQYGGFSMPKHWLATL